MKPDVAVKIGISIVVGFLFAFFLGMQCGCISSCAAGYESLYAAPQTKYYDPQFVGAFNDWKSTSGDKVADVLSSTDGEFIFLWSDTIPQAVVLVLNLDGWVVHSDTFMAPEYPATRTVSFYSTTDPNGNPWTLTNSNKTQGQVDDYNFYNEQSYKFYKQPTPLHPWTIASVGLKAVIQFGADLDQIQLRVLKIEKVLKYVD